MDAFAQIAKEGIGGRTELLSVPLPPQPPTHSVTLECCSSSPTEAAPKMQTHAQLQDALQEMRQRYAPFLAEVAPALESMRQTCTLSDFRWKREEDTDWQKVSLPHYGAPLGNASTQYETEFTLREIPTDRRVFVVVNGADYKAHIFINNHLVGSHEGFFATFEFDITKWAHPGCNTLTIELENDYVMLGNRTERSETVLCGDKIYAATGPGYDDPQLGWHHCPPGMGLLDTVLIETRPEIYFQTVFARCLEEEVEFWIEVGSCVYEYRDISFLLSVYGQNLEETVLEEFPVVPSTGKQLGVGDTYSEVLAKRDGTLNAQLPLPCGKGQNLYKVRIPATSLRRWEPDAPWLYQIQLKLLDETGSVVDTHRSQFGFRTFRQQTEKEPRGMFFLNERPIRLRGANTMGFEQQDVMRGDDAQLIDDILLAKLCHMNFWRITQRPVQQKVYDFCDRLGLMVQTDLPLFSCLRRRQFCEAVRQAEEMERHIRSHACCILSTYINEPFPNAANHPNLNLDRSELERFFAAADIAVRLNNPDRVIKHVDGDYDPPSSTLPDNHCYPMWYNGHGIDIGKLHKGYWMPVQPGWYYGCGEFGCEGLEDWTLMQERYPASWLPLPGEPASAWSPERIVRAQTADFYHFFYDRPDSPEEWVKSSQAFQAYATRVMTEAFRRDDRMISFAIHLFIDAFPSGWMKAIMDCRRMPKPAFFAYRDALEPLMISLRTDKTVFFSGEDASAEGWICNDTEQEGEFLLRYELLCGDRLLRRAEEMVHIEANRACCLGTARFRLPEVDTQTRVTLRAFLLSGQECLAWNELAYNALPACGDEPELIVRSAREISEEDLCATEDGGILWVDSPEAGDYSVDSLCFSVRESGMSPLHFASPKTGHPWVTGLGQELFRHWYSSAEDRIAPLADCTVQAEGFSTVLTSRNIGESGTWEPAAVLCERRWGKGLIVLSQIPLSRMRENPAGRILLSRIRA